MRKQSLVLCILFLISMITACSVKGEETMSDKSITTTINPELTITPTTVPAVPISESAGTAAATEAPSVTITESDAGITDAPKVSPVPIDYTGKKLVALTFDDGPNIDTTPLVLDKLEKYGIVASFFLEGQKINAATKKVIDRQLSLGCELDNHSWSHPDMSKFTPDQIKKEVEDTNNIINETAGVTPQFFRPPFIALSNDMYLNIDLPFICGIACTDWDPSVSAEKRAEVILTTVKDGDIILLHDLSGNINTVTALDEIIPGLLDQGYAFVTVSKLFELKGVEPNVEYKIWTNTGN